MTVRVCSYTWPAEGHGGLSDETVADLLTRVLQEVAGGARGARELRSEVDLEWGEMLMAATRTVRRTWHLPVGSAAWCWTSEPVAESSRGVSSGRHEATSEGLPGALVLRASLYSSVTHPGTFTLDASVPLDQALAERVRAAVRTTLLGSPALTELRDQQLAPV